MIKRLAISAAILASVIAGAATLDLEGVNKAISEILVPFNTQSTTAFVKFTALEVDEVLTQHFGVNAAYTKLGSENMLELRIPTVDYRYNGDNGMPTLDATGTMKLDLVKAFGQRTLNDVAAGAEEFVNDFLEDLTEEYGDAATTDAAVDLLERDENGDVTRVKIHVSATIDLGKLPEGKSPEKEWLISGGGALDVSRTDAKLDVKFVFNPGYEGFKKDQRGLKEFIEQLLAANKETYEEVGSYVAYVDRFASDVVERKAEEQQ